MAKNMDKLMKYAEAIDWKSETQLPCKQTGDGEDISKLVLE